MCTGVHLETWGKAEGGETGLSSLRGDPGAGESPPDLGMMYGENLWGFGEGRSGDLGELSEEFNDDGSGEGRDDGEESAVEVDDVLSAAANKAGL